MIVKTPDQVKRFLAENLHRFDIPSAYLGDEPNAFLYSDQEWDAAEVRHLICVPFSYHEFGGNLSVPLLYKIMNEANPKWIAERTHFPTSDKEIRILEKAGMPLFSLESKHSMGEFHTLGFTVNWTPQLTNLVKMLKMSGIPVRWRDRIRYLLQEKYPLIVMGAMSVHNPWPYAPIADIIWIGEAEDEPGSPGMVAVWSDIAACIKRGEFYSIPGRENLLHELARKYDFLFIPRMISTVYSEDKNEILGWDFKYDDIHKVIRRRYVKNLDAVPALDNALVSYYDVGMTTGQVEVARGCPASCLFCSSKIRYAPFRIRSEDNIIESFKRSIKNTGAKSVAPITLEFGDYPMRKKLLKRLLEEVTDQVSALPLRIDVWANDPGFAEVFAHSGMNRLTLAVEGNSERLRTAVSKGITKDTVMKAVSNAISCGIGVIKIYFIADLPGEEVKDTEEVLELAKELDLLRRSLGSKCVIRFQWTPFNAQAFTPFQWVGIDIGKRDVSKLFRTIKDKYNIGYSMGSKAEFSLRSFIQLAEIADSIAGEAIVDAIEETGAVYRGGVTKMLFPFIETILVAKYGVKLEKYWKEKSADFVFAWDLIDMRVNREYLWRMYQMYQGWMAGTYTPTRQGFLGKFGKCNYGCEQCGACLSDEQKKGMREMFAAEDLDLDLSKVTPLNEKEVAAKWRFKVWIDPDKRFVDNDHWRAAIRRALWMADVPVTKRSIQFGTYGMEWRGWVAGEDTVEFGLLRDVKIDWEKVNANLRGIKLLYGQKLEGKTLGLMKEDTVHYFIMDIEEPDWTCGDVVGKFKAGEPMLMKLKRDKGKGARVRTIMLQDEDIDVHEVVSDVWITREGVSLRLHLMMSHSEVSPYDVYGALFGRKGDQVYKYPAIKQGMFFRESGSQIDFLKPVCYECGDVMPTDVMGVQVMGLDPSHVLCLKCKYRVSGRMVAE
jgi:radical SAM superfamily enzyme YgiQ (UPF0313 family)